MKEKKETENQKSKRPLVFVTTGGSGGHIFPAEAIAGALVKRGMDVVFVTDKRGQAFQGLQGVRVERLMAESVSGRSFVRKVIAALKIYIGLFQAAVLICKMKPTLIIGVGGYASIPAVLAGHLAHIPVVLHEQNAVLGRANRMLAKGARLIATSFQPTVRVPSDVPQVQVGLPARPAIVACGAQPYPDVKKVFRLLVFGGSQGARFFSTKLPEALLKLPKNLRERIELTQQVRPEDMDKAHEFYDNAGFGKVTLDSFFKNMPDLLKQSHLVIGRGGASTLTELMCIGRPGIIIPLPSAADNHQAENARIFSDAGAGWMVVESDFDAERFSKRLEQLIQNPGLLKEAAAHAVELRQADAAEKMADVVCDLIKGKRI